MMESNQCSCRCRFEAWSFYADTLYHYHASLILSYGYHIESCRFSFAIIFDGFNLETSDFIFHLPPSIYHSHSDPRGPACISILHIHLHYPMSWQFECIFISWVSPTLKRIKVLPAHGIPGLFAFSHDMRRRSFNRP